MNRCPSSNPSSAGHRNRLAEDRAQFLDDACRHDAGLREAIESLIDAHDRLKARHFTAPTGVGIRLDLFGDLDTVPAAKSPAAIG